jgi:hypothetical protein
VLGATLSVKARSALNTVTVLVPVVVPVSVVVAEVTVAEPFRVVCPASLDSTFTTNVIVALAPPARVPLSVHVTVPEFPTPGFVQLQPAGTVTDAKVV